MECIRCTIFGSIGKVKGYERAIKVVENNPKIHLLIAGPLWNPQEQKVVDWLKKKEKELKNLKVEIRMLGENEFEKYVRKTDIILLPYWSVVPASGIFPRLLRYMKPMVTWRNPDFKDYENDFGACVTAGSVKELEEKIIKVYKSPKLRSDLRKGAKKLIKERSWKNIAKEHIKMYKAL